MRAVLRAGDSIYRVGGEEILVVLPGASERTRSRSPSACARRCASGARSESAVTISIGVAVSKPDTVDTDDLVARADAALYSAKAGGRDMVFAVELGWHAVRLSG